MTPIEQLQAVGYSDLKIGEWCAQRRMMLEAAGFGDDEIAAYLFEGVLLDAADVEFLAELPAGHLEENPEKLIASGFPSPSVRGGGGATRWDARAILLWRRAMVHLQKLPPSAINSGVLLCARRSLQGGRGWR